MELLRQGIDIRMDHIEYTVHLTDQRASDIFLELTLAVLIFFLSQIILVLATLLLTRHSKIRLIVVLLACLNAFILLV